MMRTAASCRRRTALWTQSQGVESLFLVAAVVVVVVVVVVVLDLAKVSHTNWIREIGVPHHQSLSVPLAVGLFANSYPAAFLFLEELKKS